jgi:hypothetical protein
MGRQFCSSTLTAARKLGLLANTQYPYMDDPKSFKTNEAAEGSNFEAVCSINDLPVRGGRRFVVGPSKREVALFRTKSSEKLCNVFLQQINYRLIPFPSFLSSTQMKSIAWMHVAIMLVRQRIKFPASIAQD